MQDAHQRKTAAGAVFKVACSGEDRRNHGGGNPEVKFQRWRCALESLGRDANDGEFSLVDAEVLADGAWRAFKPGLPIIIGDDHEGLGSGSLGLLGPEKSTDDRFQPECGEIVAGDELTVGALGRAGLADVDRHHLNRNYLAECGQLGLQTAILKPRSAWIAAGLGARLD